MTDIYHHCGSNTLSTFCKRLIIIVQAGLTQRGWIPMLPNTVVIYEMFPSYVFFAFNISEIKQYILEFHMKIGLFAILTFGMSNVIQRPKKTAKISR